MSWNVPDNSSSPPPACGGRRRGERVQYGKASESTRQRTTMNHADNLRKNATEAEKKLWRFLRNNQLGTKFRRQQSIGPFIADFVSMEYMLVIELDGGQHTEANDAPRTAFLTKAGYTVLRYWNHEVMADATTVAEDIQRRMAGMRSPLPTSPRKRVEERRPEEV